MDRQFAQNIVFGFDSVSVKGSEGSLQIPVVSNLEDDGVKPPFGLINFDDEALFNVVFAVQC